MRHVRLERRVVYVSSRGGRLTKRAAYNGAAHALINARCDCEDGVCDAQPGCQCQRVVCQYHGDDGYLERLHPRLVRFLKFVDSKQGVVR